MRNYRLELLVFAGVLVCNFLWLGHVGVFDVDEAIFAEATREMDVTGDLVTPYYNGGFRWDKPPLIYWCMVPWFKLLGPTALAARCNAAFSGAVLALVLMLFGRATFGRSAGVAAGLVMATCLHGYLLTHLGITDATLSLLMACSWITLWLAAAKESRGWALAAGLFLGLGTLCKGPVAVVLPIGTWAIWLLLCRTTLRVVLKTQLWWAILLYAGIVTPWCVAIYLRHGMAFFESFLGYHNLNRLTTTQSGHGGPVYTFLLVMIVGLVPWTWFAVSGWLQAARRPGEHDGLAGYVGLWLLFVLGLFSLSQTKLPNYIAPGYPAAALLAGWAIGQVWDTRAVKARWLAWPGVLGLFLIGLGLCSTPFWLPGIQSLRNQLGGAAMQLGSGPPLAGVSIMILASAAAWAWRRGPRVGLPATLAAAAGSWLAIWLAVIPVVYFYQEGPVRAMTVAAVEALGESGELATLNVHNPSVAYTARRTFTRFTGQADDPELRRELGQRFGQRRPILMLTLQRRIGDLLNDADYYVWASRLGWQLIGNQPPPDGFTIGELPWREADYRGRGGGYGVGEH